MKYEETDWNDAIQEFSLTERTKPLRMCIAVRAPGTAFGRRALEPLSNGRAPLRIPITDREAACGEHAITPISQLTYDLEDEGLIRVRVEPTMETRRDCSSITNTVQYVTKPRTVHTSVV